MKPRVDDASAELNVPATAVISSPVSLDAGKETVSMYSAPPAPSPPWESSVALTFGPFALGTDPLIVSGGSGKAEAGAATNASAAPAASIPSTVLRPRRQGLLWRSLARAAL